MTDRLSQLIQQVHDLLEEVAVRLDVLTRHDHAILTSSEIDLLHSIIQYTKSIETSMNRLPRPRVE